MQTIAASSEEASQHRRELTQDLPRYFDEIIGALRAACGPAGDAIPESSAAATEHGRERFRLGFAIDDVVRDYGAVCDAITEAAIESRQEISVAEYRALNQSFDAGIAQAVSEYTKRRDFNRGATQLSHLGFVAHELRDALASAIFSAQLIRRGQVAPSGRVAAVLERSHRRLHVIIEKMLADVRLESGHFYRQPISVAKLLEEVEGSCYFDAGARSVTLSVQVADELTIEGDPHLLLSAVGNIVRNAIKFTHAGGNVYVRARGSPDDHLVLEVEDECGGLVVQDPNELFKPFEQRAENRSGLGLGLSITRQAVQAHRGVIGVRNLEGRGCIFVLELPLQQSDGAATKSELV